MSEYKIFARRIGLIGAVNLLSGLSGIILLPIFSRNLPLADYGIWAQVNVTMGLGTTIMIMGLPDALTRFLAAAKAKEEVQEGFYTTFLMILASAIVLSMLMLLISGPFSILFGGNMAVTRLMPLLISLASLNVFLSYYFRTVQQMKRYSLFSLSGLFLDMTLTSYLVIIGQGVYGAMIGLVISRALLFSAMLILIVSNIGIKVPRFTDARAYLAFGLPLVPSFLSSWVINSSDRYVITLLIGTASVGLYSPGYMLGNILVMFIGPIGLVLPVALSKYYDENKSNIVEIMLNRSTRYFLALAVPSAFGLAILSRPILSVLSTPEISSHGYAITPFIAASMLLYGVISIISNILSLKKNTVVLGKVWAAAAILNVVLTFILVHYLGIIGAAIAKIAAFILIFLLVVYYSSEHMKLNREYRFIAKTVLASLIMIVVVLIWTPTKLWEIFAVIGVCVMVYFSALFLLGGIEKGEIAFIKEMLSNKS
jgi:O-antigen/teichoic acid export membrane protein